MQKKDVKLGGIYAMPRYRQVRGEVPGAAAKFIPYMEDMKFVRGALGEPGSYVGASRYAESRDKRVLGLSEPPVNHGRQAEPSSVEVALDFLASLNGEIPNRDNAPEGWVWMLSTPRDLYSEWEQFTINRAEADRQSIERAKAQAHRKAAWLAERDSMVQLLAKYGVEPSPFSFMEDRSGDHKVTLTFTDIKKLTGQA